MLRFHPAACVAAAILMLGAGSSYAQRAEQSTSVSAADQKFLNYAAENNQAEIQLCLIAEKRSLDPALKAFSRLMVDDHTEIESRLAALGNQLNADLADGIGKEGQETASDLKPLNGEQFERKFIDAQIKDHSNDVEKFSQEESSTQNQRIRQFTAETIPVLQQHLALARAVKTQLDDQTIGKGGK